MSTIPVRQKRVATAARDTEMADLLALALSRPPQALLAARAVLAGRPDPSAASAAHQTVGIVLRDSGDTTEALRAFRRALAFARTAGRADREADVMASLGVALALAGRTKPGLEALTGAVGLVRGAARGRALMRRGAVLVVLGQHVEAIADLTAAIAALGADRLWRARALGARGLASLAVGDVTRADIDLIRAEVLFAEVGQEWESAHTVHNRGLVAFGSGDLPQALRLLGAAGRRFVDIGVPIPDIVIDRGAVLLSAGLPREALDELEAALRDVVPGRVQAVKLAELLLATATAALAAGDPVAARQRAEDAARRFARQQRDWWAARAGHVALCARHTAGERGRRLLHAASESALRLDELRSDEAPAAHLIAGRIASDLGDRATAERHWERASAWRRRGPALTVSVGWLAEALRRQAAGNARGVQTACRRGLEVLDDHLVTLGATELRALATGYGTELAAMAQREALRAHAPRRLLWWSERWRATALAVPAARSPDDPRLATDLAALRDLARRLGEAHAVGAPSVHHLERERRRLEHAVRERTRQVQGTGTPFRDRFDSTRLQAELGDAVLIELMGIDEMLHAVVVCGQGVWHQLIGPMAAAIRELELSRFSLRRLARGRTYAGVGEVLDHAGASLEAALLGSVVEGIGDRPVVVVPPGNLHAVPWGLMPSLRARPVSVAPSAAAWLRARLAIPPPNRRVALVVGPGLGAGGGEVAELAVRFPEALVLGHGSATAERVLTALEGAWLGHIAAHGTFRADSPLFSSLELDDGPLIVHDFARLAAAPYRLVLSCCDSGVAAPVGADELLGLVSALLPLGTAGLLASVTPVNDEATVPLMLAVSDALVAGRSLPEALVSARMAVGGDPVARATAASFVTLGV